MEGVEGCAETRTIKWEKAPPIAPAPPKTAPGKNARRLGRDVSGAHDDRLDVIHGPLAGRTACQTSLAAILIPGQACARFKKLERKKACSRIFLQKQHARTKVNARSLHDTVDLSLSQILHQTSFCLLMQYL